jgi:hypothetical protein
MAGLYLSVDCGGSQTKIIYQISAQDAPQYELMSPLVEEIAATKLATYLDRKSSIGSPAPRQEAYLEWQERVFVVGDLANQFDPEDRTNEQKYENALYKVAAAIGVIIDKSKLKLDRKKLELNIGVLLPWDEYNDREIFEARLRTILANFKFRSTVISGRIEQILIRPEGGGIAATYIRRQGHDWLHDHKLAVLMFGHRNTTCLYFDCGKLTGDSPLLGFVNFLDAVIERKSGLEREQLSNAVIDTIDLAYDDTHQQDEGTNNYPKWAEYQPIKNLAKAKDVELRTAEGNLINSAIESAQAEYWAKIHKWLSKILPSDVDVVILNGGGSQFLEPDLECYFNACHGGVREYYRWKRNGVYIPIDKEKPMPKLIWGGELLKSVCEKFKIDEDKDSHNLAIRLTDCYGLFDYLLGIMESKNVSK